MWEWGLSNSAVVRQRRGRQETTMARSVTLPENAYHKELKPISGADKEYIDEHESDSEIVQYDIGKASVESEESHNYQSLKWNEMNCLKWKYVFNKTLIKVKQRCLYWFYNIYFEDIICESCTPSKLFSRVVLWNNCSVP